MSSAHRPTWTPAQGKEGRQNSRSYSSRDIAAHTKLKFRQPGQGTKDEHARRDLKLELLQAERDAAARKAKGERGYVQDQKLLALASSTTTGDAPTTENGESESAAKRRKMLQEVADLDKDDSDDDDEADEHDGAIGAKQDKGKGRATSNDDDDDDDSDEDSDDDDDEDETAELLRELEKIKKERAEEKERQERERAENEQVSRDEEIATGNPLLNLQAALGHSPAPSTISSSSAATSFGVKRRWDDDVIFKNQARGVSETPKKEFVNDLLRTEYHKKFMSRFVA
ncbi:hypothetical protein BMF94_6638 [Rhodotorula taiwanensis]|uniref:Cwf15/Cwc15 cell cycle control protein n=1 Tax=Rhodotorula taiwanensis TaxID=741276 RepID=A0A2S5B0P7_9BASI|nr:hypothetical protein BMF94_6638 [Rhodotorula taiwanensis]